MHGVICILCLNLSYCTVRSWAQTKIAMWNNLATLGLSCVITVLSMLVNAGGRSPPADLIQHKQTEAPLASRVTYLQHAHSPVHAGRFRRPIQARTPLSLCSSPFVSALIHLAFGLTRVYARVRALLRGRARLRASVRIGRGVFDWAGARGLLCPLLRPRGFAPRINGPAAAGGAATRRSPAAVRNR